MKTKKRNLIVAIAILFLLMLALLAAAFLIKKGTGKETVIKGETEESEYADESMTVREEPEEETAGKEGVFRKQGSKNQASGAAEKGGSKTLEVIEPQEEVPEQNTEKTGEHEMLFGVW